MSASEKVPTWVSGSPPGRSVSVLARRVIVKYEHYQPRPFTCLRPLEHFSIATGIAKGCIWTLADEQIDANSLAGPIIDQKWFRLAHQLRFAVRDFVLVTMLDPTTCSGGTPYTCSL